MTSASSVTDKLSHRQAQSPASSVTDKLSHRQAQSPASSVRKRILNGDRACRGQSDFVLPPSTGTLIPLIYAAAGEAKNAIAAAISSG